MRGTVHRYFAPSNQPPEYEQTFVFEALDLRQRESNPPEWQMPGANQGARMNGIKTICSRFGGKSRGGGGF
jgi:hypothetical protein